MKNLSVRALVLGITVLLSACKKEEPTPPADGTDTTPPRYTTLQLAFTDAESNSVFRMRFSDPDGEGGVAPTVVADELPGGRAFNVVATVLDGSRSPAVDLTPGLLNEGVRHQFFFPVQDAALSFLYNDADANGAPIGQRSIAISGAAGTGTMEVLLVQGPDKEAAGVAQGDPAQAGGTVLLRATFPLVIN